MIKVQYRATPAKKELIIGFLWQHTLLIVSLFVMTFGVALCVRSMLGSSVISTIPYIMTLAGESGDFPASLTIGQWTYVMNFVLVGLQIAILRRRFQAVQLAQLIIGFLFGWLLDLNMAITGLLPTLDTIIWKSAAQFSGCTILGMGIAMEIRCGSVTMPGEGLPAAISKACGAQFAKAKISVDICLVAIAVGLGYLYFGRWMWMVVGPGTLFAMIYVGFVVKGLSSYMAWFDRLLCYRPGFRRYLFGLLPYIRKRNQ